MGPQLHQREDSISQERGSTMSNIPLHCKRLQVRCNFIVAAPGIVAMLLGGIEHVGARGCTQKATAFWDSG